MNHSPTGPLGILVSGNVLTARPNAILDRDGFDWRKGKFQWMRDGVDIPGATDQAYTTTEEDGGAQVTVRFSYTDDGGTNENVVSKPKLIPDLVVNAISALYTCGLLREPDAPGLAFWSDRLDDLFDTGMDRVMAMRRVMGEFTQSADYAQELVVQGDG